MTFWVLDHFINLQCLSSSVKQHSFRMYKSLFGISIVPIHIWQFMFATLFSLPASCMTLLAFQLSLHASNFPLHKYNTFMIMSTQEKTCNGELWFAFSSGSYWGPHWEMDCSNSSQGGGRNSRDTRICITFG